MQFKYTRTITETYEPPQYIVDSVRDLANKGLKISAIKLLRAYVHEHCETAHVGLKEAKDAVEALIGERTLGAILSSAVRNKEGW